VKKLNSISILNNDKSKSISIFFYSLSILFYFSSLKGTGTAPFRSFWQELDEIKSQTASFNVPKVWLFFGCRTRNLDLYRMEKEKMLEMGILDKVFLALSREINIPKVS
jgi:hypothetical protein